MNKPKIGIIHYTYPPVIGGVEKIVYDHAQLFAKYGYPITVIAGEGENNNKIITFKKIPALQSLGITDPQLRKTILEDASYPADFATHSESIYKLLKQACSDIDILFIHNVMTMSFNPCLTYALTKLIKNEHRRKYVVWVHDGLLGPDRKKKIFRNPQLSSLFYEPQENANYAGISEQVKKTLIEDIGFPAKKISIIPNGIDISSFLQLLPETQQIVKKYDLFAKDLLIFVPTKIMKHKNIDVCLRVLSHIKKVMNDAMMIITAKNLPHSKNLDYYQDILELIRRLDLLPNVLLLDDEVHEKAKIKEMEIIKDFYKLSDITIFLSSFENFGLPVIESGIMKTPIICSNLEVFKEIESENIIFVEIDDLSYIAQTLLIEI